MISNDCRIKLKEIFTDRYLENEPLSRHINFRVGGPAAVFCIVKNINELTEALSIIGDRCNHFILGGGTNVLASDRGFDGVVFKISLNSVDFQKTDMIAEAGVLSVVAARIAAEHGLSGLEWASTLPGTVGGMVRGNAGCFGGEAKDVIKYVRIIRAGKIIKLNNKDLKFSYRHSLIKDTNDIVLEAVFALQRGDKEEIKKKMAEIMVARKKSQPLKSGTAGCTFKNYEIRDNDDIENFKKLGVPYGMLKNGKISAGWLIDKAGLKGFKIGGAQISDEHGNFIINDGTATADDIVQLISVAKTKVRDKFNLQLEEEIQLFGF